MAYERLDRALDDFCRSPQTGTFALPEAAGSRWDIVVADNKGVYLGNVHRSRQPYIGPRFMARLNSDDLAALPMGVPEAEVVGQFGEPFRTWYDLYPMLDSFVPITRLFGRDNKQCDYYLFTTNPFSEVLLASLHLSYTKGSNDRWFLARISWTMESTREQDGKPGGASHGHQSTHRVAMQTAPVAGSRR